MAANAALAVAVMGGRAGVVALIGQDKYGRDSLTDLQRRGVDVRFVSTIDAPTFWTLALLAVDGEKSLVQFHTPAVQANWEGFNWSLLKETACIHAIAVEGDQILNLFEKARALGVMTSLGMEGDAYGKKGSPELLECTDLLVVNVAAALSIDSDPRKAISRFHELGVATVILTRGAQGCLLSDRAGHEYVVAGHKVETKDTTGAGDCFAGAFAFG